MASNEPWAQLVCSTDLASEPILISKNKFIIGRAKGADLAVSGNKLVSGSHCFIQKDDEGSIKLCDTSTNGTLLNMKNKLTNGMSATLTHGDEFFVVFKKGNEALRLGYIFQEMSALQDESSFDNTQSYTDSELTIEGSPMLSDQPLKEDKDDAIPAKRRKLETHTSQVPTTSKMSGEQGSSTEMLLKTNQDKTDTETSKESPADNTSEIKGEEKPKEKKNEPPPKDDFEETLMCTICQDILHDCISLQPCMHSFCSGCYSDWMQRSNECPSCRLKVDRINKNHIVNNLVEAYLKTNPDKKRSEEDLKELDGKNKISRDMLYPKNSRRHHDYDYSDEEDSDSDPDSLVEISLPNVASAANLYRFGPMLVSTTPQNRQTYGPPRSTCRQCPNFNAQLTATGQTAQPGANNPPQSTQPGSTTLNTQTTSQQPAQPVSAATTTTGPTTSTGTAPTVTAQSNTNPGISTHITPTQATPGGSTGASNTGQPSVSGGVTLPTPPAYICGPRQNHLTCQCCYNPMPDRRHERAANQSLPQTSCSICWRNFCHLYWGCNKQGCLGCIAKFKDMNFNERDLNRVLIDNEQETTILKDYLQTKSKTFKEILVQCCTKLDAKEFSCLDQNRGLRGGDTVLCYTCALKNFKELIYQYRKTIPLNEFPESVKSRADCYWGKNCRTAKNKPHHAKNFNHICEQTRFT